MGFWAHLDRRALFERGDVYRVGFDSERVARAPVRIAVLGAGGVAQSKYLPAIAQLRSRWEPLELVGLSTLSTHDVDKLSSVWGAPVYTNSTWLLRELQPDAVIVTSSDDAHAELALAALEAEAHVLVEKPIATTLELAGTMCRSAEEAGLVLVTTCNKRFSPPYAEARRLLDDGAVPQPALFSGKFVLGYEYVDLLASGVVHVFDLARHFMGDVCRVSALAADATAANVVVMLEFANGAVGSLVTSAGALSLHPWERVEIFGDHAWLCVEDQATLTLHAAEYEPAHVWSPVVPNTLVSAEEWGGYVGLLDAFLAAVRGDATDLAAVDGYRALELVVATRQSVAERASVALPLEPAAA